MVNHSASKVVTKHLTGEEAMKHTPQLSSASHSQQEVNHSISKVVRRHLAGKDEVMKTCHTVEVNHTTSKR